MFRRANDNTEDNDDKHRTRTDEPDDHVQRELFMPGLADVHAFHAADICKEGGWNPECKHPAQDNPSTTRRALFQGMGHKSRLKGEELFLTG